MAFQKGHKIIYNHKSHQGFQKGNLLGSINKGRVRGTPWNKGKKTGSFRIPNGKIITCLVCGKERYKHTSTLKLVTNSFCSRKCSYDFRNHGITPQNKKIRASIEYRLWREAVFARDNFTCQECFERGSRLNADHIKPFAYFPELRFAIDNGRTLCVPCHEKTDTYGAKAIKHKPK